jgi:hypothetical protein
MRPRYATVIPDPELHSMPLTTRRTDKGTIGWSRFSEQPRVGSPRAPSLTTSTAFDPQIKLDSMRALEWATTLHPNEGRTCR